MFHVLFDLRVESEAGNMEYDCVESGFAHKRGLGRGDSADRDGQPWGRAECQTCEREKWPCPMPLRSPFIKLLGFTGCFVKEKVLGSASARVFVPKMGSEPGKVKYGHYMNRKNTPDCLGGV